MKHLCSVINKCTTLTEMHMNFEFCNRDLEDWPEFSFILTPTITRCTHFTLSDMNIFEFQPFLNTLAAITDSTRLTHLSLHVPQILVWQLSLQPEIPTHVLETVSREAADRVTSLALRIHVPLGHQTGWWSSFLNKFTQVESLRIHFMNNYNNDNHVSPFVSLLSFVFTY